MNKVLMAGLAVALNAAAVAEWKKLRTVQDRARCILHPGDPEEMAVILAELRSHRDPESQTLAKQLEERLLARGHRQPQ